MKHEVECALRVIAVCFKYRGMDEADLKALKGVKEHFQKMPNGGGLGPEEIALLVKAFEVGGALDELDLEELAKTPCDCRVKK